MPRISPRLKILLTLVVLSVSPVVIAASLGLIDLSETHRLAERETSCEKLANSCIEAFEKNGAIGLHAKASAQMAEHPEVKRFSLVRFDGLVICDVKPAKQEDESESSIADLLRHGLSENDKLTMPVRRNGKQWITITAEFAPLAWYNSAVGKLISIIGLSFVINGLTFGLFLKRALSFMDPKNAVPKRVRNTLDTIASGIVLLDCDARIMVINDAFAAATEQAREDCIGTNLDQFHWHMVEDEVLPWQRAFETKTPCIGTVELHGGTKGLQIFNANATPIFDASEALAGVLVSFEDVTQIEAQRKDLLKAFRELEVNKEQIRRQNEALKELASRDALTGTHNRRALFEYLDDAWQRREQMENGMIGIMMDIDHFKKLNDVHGHAVGDTVLKDFVKVVKSTIGNQGFLGRYGGEEFCVVIPNCSIEDGVHVAEKMRMAIESQLAVPYSITTSLGVSSSLFGASTCQELIEEADKALYASKHSGRNQTQAYSSEIEKLVLEKNAINNRARIESQREDLPISYQAAVSLHTALMYKHPSTALHCQRVAELSITVAKGLLSVRDIYVLEIAALLHDIGKIGASDRDLDRVSDDSDRFTSKSINLQYCENGLAIVDAAFHSSDLSSVLRFHPYRFDGMGSPEDVPRGVDLPIAARIVALANAYDEMVTGADGLRKLTPEEAFFHLQLGSGTKYDPELVDRFCNMQIGWRLDSSFLAFDCEDRRIVDLGHHLERAMYAFDTGDMNTLNRRLEMIDSVAKSIEMPHISQIALTLRQNLDRKTAADLEGMLPMLQDLIECSGTLLRAYLRSVAVRSEKALRSEATKVDVATKTSDLYRFDVDILEVS